MSERDARKPRPDTSAGKTPPPGPARAVSVFRRPPAAPGRFMRYLATTGWVHALLISTMGVFLFPFLWMLSTSLKTDEELPAARVLPDIPRFRPASPFVRDVEEPERPQGVAASRWQQVLPSLMHAAEERLRAVQSDGAARPWHAPTVDAAAHRAAAARWLVGRVAARMNRRLWEGPEEQMLAEFVRLMAADSDRAARDALMETLGRVEILSVQIRSNTTEIFTEGERTAGHRFAGQWRMESGPARLVRSGDVLRVHYDFGQQRTPAVLRYEFDVPQGMKPDDLHKITVALKADDSWHQIDATLDWGEHRWESRRTSWLAQHRPMSIVFQPPGFDDTTNRARTWIPIRAAGPRQDGAAAGRATLRLVLSPSSTPAANYGKIERNYRRAFLSVPFWKYVANSVLLVALTMAGALFSASWVAYAFARLNWPGRGVAFMILLSTMMLPGQVTMIPGFMIWKTLGWYNTLNPMWVPAWFGGAFFIFLMTQHMKTVPKELEEAAKLDGLNHVQTWWYVMLPQVKPTLAAIAIMTFMGAWNEFMGPLVYLRDQSRFPLSLGLFGMRVDQGADWTMIMAGNMLMTLPVIVIFFMCQRYFIQGMTMTGMKG